MTERKRNGAVPYLGDRVRSRHCVPLVSNDGYAAVCIDGTVVACSDSGVLVKDDQLTIPVGISYRDVEIVAEGDLTR